MATPDRPDDANEAARKEGRVLVEDTLADIAALIVRTRRSRDQAGKLTDCDDLTRLLDPAAERLEAARLELQQGAYFNAGQQRLF